MNAGLLALLVPLAAAQPPLPPPGTPAPVLAARVVVPAGVRYTLLPGSPLAKSFDAPATFALRPGYVYRIELSGLPNHPTERLYPEVEVRGTLVPKPRLKYMDYPVALTFSAAELDGAFAGAVVTKVIYLEDPEKAEPVAARPDAPLHIPADTEADAVKAATENGRLVAILRLGGRRPPPEELAAFAVPGTVLLPGVNALAAPAAPPMLPWLAVPLFDPILGPKAAHEECLLDGGDRENRLGIAPRDKLGGLEPTDVGVEFTMGGKRRVTSSNVVCVCSPRFVIRKVEQAPGGLRTASGPEINAQVVARQEFRLREAPMAEIGREKPVGADARIRPQVAVTRVGPAVLDWFTRPAILAQVEGVRIRGAYVEPEEITSYPGCPLTVTKAVDPPGSVPEGAVVTFTLKYTNTGNKVVSDVVLSDSLSGRLEYLAGSAESDRAANFTAADNEAGSVVVRWELPGKLQPGQGGVVKFKARVR